MVPRIALLPRGDPAPHVRPFPGRLRWSPRPTIVRVAARILFFSSFFMSPFPRLPNLDAVALRLAVRSEFDLPLAGFEVYQAGPCCPRSVSPPSSPFQPAMLLGAGIVLWLFRSMYNFFSLLLPPSNYARSIFAWLKDQGKHSRH